MLDVTNVPEDPIHGCGNDYDVDRYGTVYSTVVGEENENREEGGDDKSKE